MPVDAGGNVGSSGQTPAPWEAAGGCLNEGRCTSCNQIQAPSATSPSCFLLSLCDIPPLSSVCVILRTGPYYYFSRQKFLLGRLFLKEFWWLMQSFSLQSAPHPWPLLPVLWRGLCPPSALQRLCEVSQLNPTSTECWASAGYWMSGIKIREKSRKILRGISGDSSGQLEEMWFKRSSLIWEWSKQGL